MYKMDYDGYKDRNSIRCMGYIDLYLGDVNVFYPASPIWGRQ
jgi:hypothetical protein